MRYVIGLVNLLPVVLTNIYIVDQKVNPDVKGVRKGTLDDPFLTIKDCISSIENGDECHIRSGRYHEEIEVTGLHGLPNKPIVIRGYQDERPIIDGTVVIKNITSWKKKGNIYSAKISTKIWQLFMDDVMMTNARWPNAKWSDKSIFDGKRWPTLALNSKRGLVVNRGNSLKNTNINMTGAIAILNIGSFNTFVAKVKNHRAGGNSFSFDDTFGNYHFKPSRSRYFLEDKLELLDAPEEWFFDKENMILHVYLPNGKHPSEIVLRGKTQIYAFKITNCEHVVFKNLNFFGTAIKADSTSAKYKVNDISFDSLNFRYHTYSKRMLGDTSLINWMIINAVYKTSNKNNWGTLTFFNNTFFGSDGVALAYYGKNVTIENNLFEYNDWTGANMITAGGGLATIKSFGIYDQFVHNTLRYNGASVGIRPALMSTVKYNDISKQCWGIIQNDGAGIQVTRRPQVGCTLERNWVHDQPKYGLRFDGEPPRIGTKGNISYNVAFRTNGIMVKGNHHFVSHNTAFVKVNGKDDDKQGDGCTLCVIKFLRKNPTEMNQNTIVANNVADVANGGKVVGTKGKTYKIAGITKCNAFNVSVRNQLVDPYNHDFRPQRNSFTAFVSAGAYKYNEQMTYYWIPGRQLYKASSPVPLDGSTTVVAQNRDAVMWLNALHCTKHNVYFSSDKEEIQAIAAGSMHTSLIGSTIGKDNVVYLKEMLETKMCYFWRVDARCGENIIYKGTIWTFCTI